jgi:hypothetical protein
MKLTLTNAALTFALLAPLAVAAQACSDDSDVTPSADDAGGGGGGNDASTSGDVARAEGGGPGDDAGGGGGDADAQCPSAWLVAPAVDPSIALPADAGASLRLHASATGTQDYQCQLIVADGGFAWTFLGPEAQLHGCDDAGVASHFASDGGAARPEWQSNDGSYVIAAKVAAYTPDGGASSVPWLLLQAVSHGGSGPVADATYVHRLDTSGGVAPSAACDVGAVGTTQKVPYTADYYFYGP